MGILVFIVLLAGYIYEDSDSLVIENDTLTRCGLHQYALKVILRNNARLFVRAASGAVDTTGWLNLWAPTIIVHDSSSIIGSERGHKGGYLNSHPWGYGTGGGSAGGVSGGAGGGGAYGGSGGAGGDIYGGLGGIAYGLSGDTLIEMGSGGGAGRLSVVDGAGGNGGASISLRGTLVEIDSSDIFVIGQRGYDGSLEAGGGGSGGGVRIWADTVAIHDVSIAARGGSGGDGAYGGGGGGSGGRIKVFYTTEIDTSGFTYSFAGGNGGQGDPQLPASSAGDPGSIYIGVFTGIDGLITQNLPGLSIQPNPLRDVADMTTACYPTRARLYDVSGRLAMTVELRQEHTRIDLGVLQHGVYFVVIENHPSQPCKIILID